MSKRIYTPQIRKAIDNLKNNKLDNEDKDVIETILYGVLKKIGLERFKNQ